MGFFKRRSSDRGVSPPQDDASRRGGLPRPALDGVEYVYIESRRVEEQSAFRSDHMPGDVYDIASDRSALDNLGRSVLPWRASSTRNLAVHPSRTSVAFVESQAPGGPFLFTERYQQGAPTMASQPGFRVLANRGYSVCGIEFSPSGDRISCLEWQGIGVLTLLDPDSGERTFLTTLEGVAGYEQPLWSPDGRWILVSTNSAPQLVSLDNQCVIRLPFERVAVDWWPSLGPSALLIVGGDAPAHWIKHFDLETNSLTPVRNIDIPRQEGLDEFRHHLSHPRVSPDGKRLLVGTSLGPDAAYQHEHGSRSRVAILDIETGRLARAAEPFVDAGRWVEREHSRWRWASVGTCSGTTLVAGELMQTGTGFVGPDPCGSYDFGGRDEFVVTWTW